MTGLFSHSEGDPSKPPVVLLHGFGGHHGIGFDRAQLLVQVVGERHEVFGGLEIGRAIAGQHFHRPPVESRRIRGDPVAAGGIEQARGDAPALGGDFAYLRCQRIPSGQLLEIDHEQVWTALQMIHLETLTAPERSAGTLARIF